MDFHCHLFGCPKYMHLLYGQYTLSKHQLRYKNINRIIATLGFHYIFCQYVLIISNIDLVMAINIHSYILIFAV